MNNKRILSTLLLMTMLLSSCASGGAENETTTDGDTGTGTGAETTDPLYADLPAGDFGGETLKFLGENMTTWAIIELCADELDGDLINDTMYAIDRRVEDKLNIKISAEYRPASGELRDVVNTAMMSGDDEYDVYDIPSHIATGLILKDSFRPISELEGISSDKPWWDENIRETLTFDGKCYSLLGDVSLMLGEAHLVMYLNKDIADTLGLEDHYELVRSGKYTLDRLGEDVRAAALDLNGNGETDFEDRFGACTSARVMTYLMISGEEPIVQTGNDGLPYFEGLSEKAVDMFGKIKSFMFDKTLTIVEGSRLVPSDKIWQSPFLEGRSLYMFEPLGYTKLMRDLDFDYAVLPMPKYDEAQKEYLTPVLQYVHTMYVTKVNGNTKMIGTALENLSAESYKELRPAYFETVLNNKRVRDDESIEMLDIIFANRVLNPLTIFDWGGLSGTLNQKAQGTSDNIVSDIAKSTPRIQSEIEKTVEYYRQ